MCYSNWSQRSSWSFKPNEDQQSLIQIMTYCRTVPSHHPHQYNYDISQCIYSEFIVKYMWITLFIWQTLFWETTGHFNVRMQRINVTIPNINRTQSHHLIFILEIPIQYQERQSLYWNQSQWFKTTSATWCWDLLCYKSTVYQSQIWPIYTPHNTVWVYINHRYH